MDRGQKFQLTSSNLIIFYILNCEFYLIYLISIFFLKGVVILPYGSDRYPVMKLAFKTGFKKKLSTSNLQYLTYIETISQR